MPREELRKTVREAWENAKENGYVNTLRAKSSLGAAVDMTLCCSDLEDECPYCIQDILKEIWAEEKENGQ